RTHTPTRPGQEGTFATTWRVSRKGEGTPFPRLFLRSAQAPGYREIPRFSRIAPVAEVKAGRACPACRNRHLNLNKRERREQRNSGLRCSRSLCSLLFIKP